MPMSRRNWIILAVLAVAVALGAWIYQRATADKAPPYRFVAVERGDIEASVAATGSLGAVTTVTVGTQVSGRVVEIHADFNDRVKKGQLIARIDPTLLQQSVLDAQAGLERARAEAEKAAVEYRRNLGLFEQKVLTEIEFNTAKYAQAVAIANVKSAQVALARAQQNLAYTDIHAPIDGIVVERNVSVGQTVAASLSAPQLFLIANDLSQMQILASVSESDIGSIRKEQPVTFNVQAFPNETFTGVVEQVRLQSTTTENIVNYTVVVTVANPGEKLLPGMTASANFITGEARGILSVPNAALRLRPTEAMLAELRKERGGDAAGAGPGAGAVAGANAGADPGARSASARPTTGSGARGDRSPDAAALWTLDGEGKLSRLRVHTGLTDGQRTEVSGEGVAEGLQVIAGAGQAAAAPAATTSPFQSPMRGPRQPGGF